MSVTVCSHLCLRRDHGPSLCHFPGGAGSPGCGGSSGQGEAILTGKGGAARDGAERVVYPPRGNHSLCIAQPPTPRPCPGGENDILELQGVEMVGGSIFAHSSTFPHWGRGHMPPNPHEVLNLHGASQVSLQPGRSWRSGKGVCGGQVVTGNSLAVLSLISFHFWFQSCLGSWTRTNVAPSGSPWLR